jgi:hypothetical protein
MESGSKVKVEQTLKEIVTTELIIRDSVADLR